MVWLQECSNDYQRIKNKEEEEEEEKKKKNSI